jgi:hypothetical protein
LRFYRNCSGILDHPHPRVMTTKRAMTAKYIAACPSSL